MSDNSPRLDLPYIQAAQAQKHVTHNEALRVLDALVQLAVVGFDATTPPTLAQEGDIYALGIGATGDWAGHDSELAMSTDGYWQFHTPQAGWIATEAGTNTIRVWTGIDWETPGQTDFDNLPGVGINTASDDTNRLAVSAPATLLNHEGAGHQLKINKASAGDTASLMFQDNWSGRAEMGLAGDDNFHIKVSADGTAWTEALTVDAASGAVSFARAALDGVDLAAITDTIASTAVDIVVYDTSRDSDGGAWRARSQHTAWYREALNTAARGARRGFPAVAVIVAEAAKVTIFDGDDPTLPMWRVLDFTGNTVTAIAAVDGKCAVGLAANGVSLFDFAADVLGATPRYSTTTNPAIVNNAVNAVAVTVLDDAPIDPLTGLPVPTIAAATDGGVSVINDGGEVVDSVITSSMGFVDFDRYGNLRATKSSSIQTYFSTPEDYASDGFSQAPIKQVGGGTIPASWPDAVSPSGQTMDTNGIDYLSHSAGITAIKYNPGDKAGSMVAYITGTYNTGWMPGDIKGAWLAGTDTASLVGGTVADRSVNATPLDVTGTVTRAAVATGANLVASSGFSASNYFEQPYNAGLDFGTGDFCLMGWISFASGGSSRAIFGRPSDASHGLSLLKATATQAEEFQVRVNGSSADTAKSYADGNWHHISLQRTGGEVSFYVDGQIAAAFTETGSVSCPGNQYPLSLFGGPNLAYPPPDALRAALWRISATAPNAGQLARIYADERALFQPGAQCTLYGASNAVTALGHDPETGLLHVGTSAGRSDFRGLCRVSNTTTAVTTAISASGGMISEQ